MTEVTSARHDGALLERDDEFGRLGAVLDGAATGSGAVVVVEGEAGLGKSSLLQATAETARERGFQVIAARAAQLEREFPYGVVRRLFDPVLRRATADELAELTAGAVEPAATMLGFGAPVEAPAAVRELEASFVVLHGLAWLAANLSERSPLLILADDAQWADDPSLAWLAFMARRVADLPVAVVAAARSPEAVPDALVELLGDSAVETLSPAPLGLAAVAVQVRAELPAATPAFTTACHSASGGNPFYVRELVRAAVAAGLTGGDAAAARVGQLAPAGVGRLVVSRLRRLPAPARAVAEAFAVLGRGATLPRVARVAGMGADAAAEAASALVDEGVLRDDDGELDFIHPVVRSAVYGELRPVERARRHAEAARLAHVDGRPAQQVAGHLVLAPAAGEDWQLEALRAAADEALRDGAPAAAARWLGRALEEDLPARLRPSLLVEHGRALRHAGRASEAEPALRAALRLTGDPVVRAGAGLELARAWDEFDCAVERLDELDALAQALDPEERELRYRLEAELLNLEFFGPVLGAGPRYEARCARLRREATGDTPGELQILLTLVQLDARRGRLDADAVVRVTRRALTTGVLLRALAEGAFACSCAIELLLLCDRLDEAETAAETAERYARTIGSARSIAYTTHLRGVVAARRGALDLADTLFRTALEVAGGVNGNAGTTYYPLVSLAETCVRRGHVDEAAALLANEDLPPSAGLHAAMAELAAARGDAGALDHWRSVERRLAPYELKFNQDGAYAPSLALALAATGEGAEALTVAERAVADAQAFGVASAIARALHARGLIRRGDAGVADLEAALGAIEGSGCQLERAELLIDFGAAQRRAGRPGQARESLSAGVELARRCGARPLAERGWQELSATGVRRRGRDESGWTLTPSERRVAELAAAGRSNKGIAQALFLSVKTIEMHLSRAYAKLGIRSRAELAAALDGADVARAG